MTLASPLHNDDYWLVIGNVLVIAREKWEDANGRKTIDIFQNLENYKKGKVDFKNFRVLID